MTEEQNVPPSDDVRDAQEEAWAESAFRRDLVRYYGPYILLAAFSIGTIWWNATTISDRLWWYPPAIATFWIVWGAFGSTQLRTGAYEHGWVQATAFTMMAFRHGRVPPLHPPHQASSHRVSEAIQSWGNNKDDDE